MLSVQDIIAAYGKKTVLADVTIEVRRGEFLGLIGPNGSGKTTLLRVMSGVLAPKRGTVRLGDAVMKTLDRRAVARTIAFLPQDLSLEFSFTVRDLVAMGRTPHRSPMAFETPEDADITEASMEFTGVAHLADRVITELSGGERQRVFIAMCLAQQPEVLILDEPTNHLDIGHQLSTLDLIRKRNREHGMTVISVFHDLNLAAEYCDRLAVLDAGRIEAQGTPDEVFTAETIRTVFGVRVAIERNAISQKPHVVVSAGQSGPTE